MSNLTKYNAARTALAEAHAVDEVKDIRDKAEAMAAYARQAKDTEMIAWVTEIKVRAERRAGQLLAEMPKNIGAAATRSHDTTALPKTLDDLGISKDQSSRWQKLAAVSDEKFEHAVAAAKDIAGEVTTAAMLRAAKEGQPKVEPAAKPPKSRAAEFDAPAELRELNELREANAEQGQTIKELLEENKSLAEVMESGDQLAAALAEAKKYREMNRILEERIRGLMNEKNEAIRAAKMWQRKAEKAA